MVLGRDIYNNQIVSRTTEDKNKQLKVQFPTHAYKILIINRGSTEQEITSEFPNFTRWFNSNKKIEY